MFGRSRHRRIALAAAAIVTGVVLLGGVALGALDPGSSLTRLATTPSPGGGALAEDGRGDRAKSLAAVLDRLVAEGVITAEQQARIVAAVRDASAGTRPDAKRFLGRILENAARAMGIGADELKRELPGSSLAQVAQAHGVSRDTLVSRLVADANAAVDTAVGNGRLSVEQARKVKERLPELLGRSVDRTWPAKRPGADGATRAKAVVGDLLRGAAEAIGIDGATLRRELPGTSLAQVAQQHGLSREALLSSLSSAATQRIDDAVAAGRLDADQASRLRAALPRMLERLVDRTVPARAARP